MSPGKKRPNNRRNGNRSNRRLKKKEGAREINQDTWNRAVNRNRQGARLAQAPKPIETRTTAYSHGAIGPIAKTTATKMTDGTEREQNFYWAPGKKGGWKPRTRIAR